MTLRGKASSTLSATGDEIGVLAMLFRLAEDGHSVAVALLLIASLAPAVLLAPLTGHLVDRLDAGRLLVAASLVQAVRPEI